MIRQPVVARASLSRPARTDPRVVRRWHDVGGKGWEGDVGEMATIIAAIHQHEGHGVMLLCLGLRFEYFFDYARCEMQPTAAQCPSWMSTVGSPGHQTRSPPNNAWLQRSTDRTAFQPPTTNHQPTNPPTRQPTATTTTNHTAISYSYIPEYHTRTVFSPRWSSTWDISKVTQRTRSLLKKYAAGSRLLDTPVLSV